jgi:hypothetical protein
VGFLLLLGVILFILWALGFWFFSWGGIVHILVVVAVILIILWLLRALFRRR